MSIFSAGGNRAEAVLEAFSRSQAMIEFAPDGTILNARKGIPIVTCGPGDIYIPHHIDEWVSVDEISWWPNGVVRSPAIGTG